MILRWILGGLFLYSGGIKIFNLLLFKATILAYYQMPEALALLIAIVFPWLEILAGLSLLVKYQTKYSSGFLSLLTLFFFAQMVLNYSHVLPYGCGCFGFGGAEEIGLYQIVRDFLIAVLAGVVFYREYHLARQMD